MKRKWTVDEARSYVMKVQKGKIPSGLTYCSAIDFLINHTKAQIDNESFIKIEDENDTAGVTG